MSAENEAIVCRREESESYKVFIRVKCGFEVVSYSPTPLRLTKELLLPRATINWAVRVPVVVGVNVTVAVQPAPAGSVDPQATLKLKSCGSAPPSEKLNGSAPFVSLVATTVAEVECPTVTDLNVMLWGETLSGRILLKSTVT
jgi:hypothetical protein